MKPLSLSLRWQVNILLLAQFLVIAGIDMADPYWPLIVRHFTSHSPQTMDVNFWSAAVYIAPLITIIIFAPIWNQLGQRFGYKKMIIRASVMLAITQLALAFTTNLPMVLIIRLLQGIFAGFTAAAQTWLINSTHKKLHSRLVGQVQSYAAMGSIIGPMLGGVLAHYFHYRGVFIVGMLIFAITSFLLLRVLQEVRKHAKSMKKQIAFSLKKLRNSEWIFLSLICFTQTAKWMNSSFFAVYVVRTIEGNNLIVGMLYSITAIMIFFASPRWGAIINKLDRNLSALSYIFIGVLLLAASTQILFALTHSVYAASAASALWGLALSATILIPFCWLINNTIEENKSWLIGLSSSATKLGNLLGIGLGAIIYAHSDFLESFCAIALFYVILAVLTLLMFKPRQA